MIVRHENVVAASQMNNAIVLFLQTFAQATVERGLEVDGLFVPVIPLSIVPIRENNISIRENIDWN